MAVWPQQPSVETPSAALSTCPFILGGLRKKALAPPELQRPLVSFSRVTLTQCEMSDSITRRRIDYSHASFCRQFFYVNWMRNSIWLWAPDRWMEAAHSGQFTHGDGFNLRLEVNLPPVGWTQSADRGSKFVWRCPQSLHCVKIVHYYAWIHSGL